MCRHQGAAAVLEFYAIESPLAQPRNAIVGHLLSAIVGVSVRKLFALSPTAIHNHLWAGGALACAAATSVMALTGTVHPPAGATALGAVVDDRLANIGWWLLPAVVLGSTLMLAVALVVNNIQRRFPVYWWTPERIGSGWDRLLGHTPIPGAEDASDKSSTRPTKDGDTINVEMGDGNGGNAGMACTGTEKELDGPGPVADHGGAQAVRGGSEILISSRGVTVTKGIQLRPEELAYLEGLAQRLSAV